MSKKRFTKLTESQEKKLNKIITKHFRYILKHFREDGWDIDFHMILDDVMSDFFGGHVSDKVLSKFMEKGFGLTMQSYGLAITDPQYEPVFYDEYTNKIVMPGKNYEGMDYREVNGYINLGRL